MKISDDIGQHFSEVHYQLGIEIPEELRTLYKNTGYEFLWFSLKQKKGLYRIFSPEEILDLYFEPESRWNGFHAE